MVKYLNSEIFSSWFQHLYIVFWFWIFTCGYLLHCFPVDVYLVNTIAQISVMASILLKCTEQIFYWKVLILDVLNASGYWIWSMRYWLGTCRSHPAYLPSEHTNGFMCVLSIRLFTCTCRHPLRPVGVTCSYKLLNVGSGNLPGLQEQQEL